MGVIQQSHEGSSVKGQQIKCMIEKSEKQVSAAQVCFPIDQSQILKEFN